MTRILVEQPVYGRWLRTICMSRFWILITCATLIPACNTRNEPSNSITNLNGRTPVVYTVNYPLAWFAERIAGDTATIVFPAPPDVDPASWSPDASVINEYQQADLILLNGADYAHWTATATLPRSKLVDTSASAADQYIEVADAIVHQHGPGGEHSHPGLASTTWLDPSLAIVQASATRDALVRLLPNEQASLEANTTALIADLEALDEELAAAFQEFAETPVLFSGPVYQYLERRYRLNGRSVRWKPHQAPSDAEWDDLEAILQDHPAEVMIWTAEPDSSTVERLDRLGLRSVTFASCANAPDSGDFLSVMHENARRLRETAEVDAE